MWGGADINVTNDAGDDVQPSFSPDGRQIAFVSTRGGASALYFSVYNAPPKGGDIWVLPALGGNARRVATSGNFPSWYPNGTDLVYTSGPWFGPRLYRVSAAGGTPQEIKLEFPQGVSPPHLLYPRVSADGRWIVLSSPTDLYVVSASGGVARTVARGLAPVWDSDSRSIIYSNDEAGANQSLWSVAFDPETGNTVGPPRPVTLGRGADMQATASKDGSRIAFAATTVTTQIESQSIDAERGRLGGPPAPVTVSRDQVYFFDISNDGSGALFELRRGLATTIWRTDGSRGLVQLASDARFDHNDPLWSPDGQTIAFSRRLARNANAPFSLWTMASDGANPQQVIERLGLNGLFTWMPDGRGIVHVGQGRQLYLLDLTSGTERRLTNEPGVMPVVVVTADGKWVIYQCVVGETIDLHAVGIDGGEPRVVVASPGAGLSSVRLAVRRVGLLPA